MNTEFFLDNNNGTDIIVNQDGKFSTLDEKHPIVDQVYKTLKCNYSEAFKVLNDIYGKSAFFKFLIVRRFLKCNFSKHDEKPDIDSKGFFDVEFVSCPMRGECKHEGIICKPTRDKTLTDREIEIVKLISLGNTDFEISEMLFISPHTAKNHRKNILHKTDCPNTAALIAYVTEHKII